MRRIALKLVMQLKNICRVSCEYERIIISGGLRAQNRFIPGLIKLWLLMLPYCF